MKILPPYAKVGLPVVAYGPTKQGYAGLITAVDETIGCTVLCFPPGQPPVEVTDLTCWPNGLFEPDGKGWCCTPA
jgi:hypothetical protein